jgi:hypothetical protein
MKILQTNEGVLVTQQMMLENWFSGNKNQSITIYHILPFKKRSIAKQQWLTLIILATWEAEIRRIPV